MSIVSYRLYCDRCDEDTVVKEDDLDDSPWKVNSLISHEGLCPSCNEQVSVEDTEWSPEPEELELEELDNIGAKAAQNLREAGYDSTESIAEADDDEILDVSWVGEKALFSLKEEAKQHEPQERWD